MTPEFPIPKQFKSYLALVTQTGTAIPVSTILHNTLGGTPIWTYTGVGDYRLTLNGAFPQGKTTILTQTTSYDFWIIAGYDGLAPDKIAITTTDTTGAPSNGMLYQTTLLIIVKNT